MDETRIIATFDTPNQADEAADRLDEAGIEVQVEEAPQIGDDPMFDTETGGVALRIQRNDEPRARDLLDGEFDEAVVPEVPDDFDADPFSDTDPIEEEEWEEITEGIRCPECHSKELGLGTPLFQALVAGIVATFVAMVVFTGTLASVALAAWGVLLLILVIGLGLRRFPLVCKDCGHRGLRDDFDPTKDS